MFYVCISLLELLLFKCFVISEMSKPDISVGQLEVIIFISDYFYRCIIFMNKKLNTNPIL